METRKVLTRDNISVEELIDRIEIVYKGVKLNYQEVYYLDSLVCEDTGVIKHNVLVKHYTRGQMERNLKALKNAYLIHKGAVDPKDIIDFRNKYNIPASTLSLILGFSKNTISNIEHDGINSLPSGRLIKMCMENKDVLNDYIQLCDSLDSVKKEQLSRRLLEEALDEK